MQPIYSSGLPTTTVVVELKPMKTSINYTEYKALKAKSKLKFSSDIEEQRSLYYIPEFDRPRRIKDLSEERIRAILRHIKNGEITETSNYSLPYLQYVLETELKIRPLYNFFVVNKILKTMFPDSKNWKVIKDSFNDEEDKYLSETLFYA